MNRSFLLILAFSFLSLGWTFSMAISATAPAKEETKKKTGTSTFELNKKDPIYITADWMEVDQNKNTITYKGRVVAVQSDMTMRSETLTGNPVMRQGNSQVSGTKVVYFMDQDRAIAEGDGKIRVQATIFPEELKSQDDGDAKS